LHPSIEKKDGGQIGAEEQWRLDRFKKAVALELAFDGPNDAQHYEEDPPVLPHQLQQPQLSVHLRAVKKPRMARGGLILSRLCGSVDGRAPRLRRSGPRAARAFSFLGRTGVEFECHLAPTRRSAF
jgi:hypothetical protein